MDFIKLKYEQFFQPAVGVITAPLTAEFDNTLHEIYVIGTVITPTMGFFFIEKGSNDQYVVHETKIYRPREGMKIIDYENIPANKAKKDN